MSENIDPQIDTVCPHPIPIYTDRQEEEIWQYMDKLSSLHYVRKLLRWRIDSDAAFRRFKGHVDELNRSRQLAASEETNLVTHQILSDNQDIENNAKEINVLTRQAIELYRASKAVSIYAKPILLYYSFSKLARVLFLGTFKSEEPLGGHGLSLEDNTTIECQREGAFARFHDSYSWNPMIYLSKCKFRWEDLICEEQCINRYTLILNMKNCNFIYLNEKKSKTKYVEHELTRELIFTYAMSMLSRYKVQKWGMLIESTQSDIIWKIQQYLTSVQSLFPNLVFNQLHGQQYYFFPSEPEYILKTEVTPQKVHWVL